MLVRLLSTRLCVNLSYMEKKTLTVTEFARLGGKARWAKLTKKERSALGKKMSLARGGGGKKKREVA